eukprot:CAMPEP_0170198474 /NCGR_PEP_ID=MMETSP0040_2-20121228/68791_1 /TAXON_ID=641309 /ORGANISM="Lotharella oceanica, Strain CCMP622" /LENGTH=74 /DNA_ID=CAMNT_0010448465 /DNA_START=278 /DNA_END=503 /DNA_ORIENTATION=+
MTYDARIEEQGQCYGKTVRVHARKQLAAIRRRYNHGQYELARACETSKALAPALADDVSFSCMYVCSCEPLREF